YLRYPMRYIISVLLLFFTSLGSYAGLDESNQLLLDSLETCLKNLDQMRDTRAQQYRQLKREYRRLPRGRKRAELAFEIGQRHIIDNIDSAIVYLNLAYSDARQLDDKEMSERLKLRLLPLLPYSGISKEAVELFENINPDELPDSLRPDYWRAACEIYHSIQIPYPKGPYKTAYMRKTLTAIDSLLRYYPKESDIRPYLNAYSFYIENQPDLATAHFVNAIPALKGHPELLDFAYKMVADHYKDKPMHRQTHINYLLLRAINTLSRGLVRAETLAPLGEVLIQEGYNTAGKECLTLAIETPDESYTCAYEALDQAYYSQLLNSTVRSSRRFELTVIAIMLLIIILLATLNILSRRKSARISAELDSSRRLERELTDESIRTNHTLISLTFLSLQQVHEYNIHILRKLKAGQVKDLYADVEKGIFRQTLREKFFEEFDTDFLEDFPGFIDKLNQLFLPERRIAYVPGDSLSPELRIAAFMRLGVNDSARLAQVLNLSLNTIYTYRNRLRGRAADRENFEKNILKII
ncbi:MAG: hypothetical protein K2J38_05490, partial [Muribaculaceae bacterium]|nr:hypothetical protein [Muribaculaceae bacterium]